MKSVDNRCKIINGGNSAMSDQNIESSFKNSLLYRALKHISDEIRSDENTYYTGEHFHNDPRDHPGERMIHYVESGRMSEALQEFRDSHPELRRNLISKSKLREGDPIAA
jgi:hypothetical protein